METTERIVDRSQLESEDDSPITSPDPEDFQKFKELSNVVFAEPSANVGTSNVLYEDGAEDEELDFRLFAAPKDAKPSQATETAQKVRLRSPSIDHTTAGFIRPTRDPKYYFAQTLSTTDQENLRASALTGEDVVAQANRPWPGSAYPWKVLKLPLSAECSSLRDPTNNIATSAEKIEAKRTRPGKKYRIKLRTKHAALQSQQLAAKAAEEAKKEAERQKRTQRNRVKKVRKKARDKEKKAKAGGEDVIADAGVDDASDG